jgi:hypothetical protein
MPIRVERTRLVDDSRTFSSEELTEAWEWLDSLDAQPLRPRDQERLDRPAFTFRPATYTFGQKIYSIARCSDGRELLGSVISDLNESRSSLGGLFSAVSRFGSAVAESLVPAGHKGA